MEFWLNEKHSEGYSVNWKFTETIHTEQTSYQHLAVINTVDFGKALVLDGLVQTTEKDEFIYHEMIVHPILMSHPNPQKVLVIGGGDGGSIREVVKYASVQQADLIEIDENVILACRKYLPEISCSLTDKRVRLFIEDGLDFVKRKQDYYDIVIVDSSDPIGPAEGLYTQEFYTDIHQALKPDGILVAQTGSPLFNKELLAAANKRISKLFPITETYLTAIPTYTGGFWSFTLGSKKYDPAQAQPGHKLLKTMNLKYYNEDIHKACFALPNFVRDLLGSSAE